jgi:hypothetical protein
MFPRKSIAVTALRPNSLPSRLWISAMLSSLSPSLVVSSRLRRTCALLLLVASPAIVRGEEPPAFSPEHLEFFEKSVRPLLVKRCFECHAGQKQQGGVRVDSRKIVVEGGEYGPVVVPSQPDASRLIQVLKFDNNDVQMPPSGKLLDEEIAMFRRWVELGAPWPKEESTTGLPSGPMTAQSAREHHWAFRAPRQSPAPVPADRSRVQTPIDAFVVARLEAEGLSLRPEADRRTLLRRLSMDLRGVPPTIDEVTAFVNDTSPDVFERVVDRYLDSPEYGERWGRYWLDVARYADTKGYVFTEEPRYPYAYTYRDYVIRALNQDKPYDRFVTEQLAADQLDHPDSNEDLAAMGFLTVGRRFLNNNHDIIDDRIDVVSRGLMGLTVTCARCHDHKFDPVPAADYYSLYGVFASSDEPAELPLIGRPNDRAAFAKFEKELADREQDLRTLEAELATKIEQEVRGRVGDYLQGVAMRAAPKDSGFKASYEHGDPRRGLVDRWQKYLGGLGNGPHAIFEPWRRLVATKPDMFVAVRDELLAEAAAGSLNPLVRQRLLDSKPSNLVELAKIYGGLFAWVEKQWNELRSKQADATALGNADEEALRQILVADGSPTRVATGDLNGLMDRAERNKQRDLAKKIDSLKVSSPGAPPRAMVLNDRPQPVNPRILVRGNPGRPGDTVPRQFLEVIAGPERQPFSHGSGRLDLATAIVSPENPLTARVIVNRVWQHHFGQGLVETSSDFGVRSEPPSHPELLDWLSVQLVRSGWSLKALHRLILASAVYQQSSTDDPVARLKDPENRLLWRMPARRLDFEAFRDSLLAVSGQLDRTIGGRPYDNVTDIGSPRRTVYALVNRNDLPGIFRAFDFADPDASAGERPRTTVPQQALFGLNSPFVLEVSRRLGNSTVGSDETARIQTLYRRVLVRDPTADELAAASNFVKNASGDGKLDAWGRLAQVLLLTNEFAFVD